MKFPDLSKAYTVASNPIRGTVMSNSLLLLRMLTQVRGEEALHTTYFFAIAMVWIGAIFL